MLLQLVLVKTVFLKKSCIATATENCHYNPQFETRVNCDASRAWLVAALEQLIADGWKPIGLHLDFKILAMKDTALTN